MRSGAVTVRALRESDLDEADRIMRVAFGTFLGLADPGSFAGDADYVRTRWRADPAAAFAAEIDGELVGSNFATRWGSVGFFGPLSIRPDRWNAGVGQRLLAPILERFAAWGTKHAGLFTFPNSPKHLGLYQKHGFHPRFLTAVTSKPVAAGAGTGGWTTFSGTPAGERAALLDACRELTGAVFEGLDVGHEIRAVADQGLGETLLVTEGGGLAALAVCHAGGGTEAGSGACYVKFGAVRPGPDAGRTFDRLLDACEALASARGLSRLCAGVNTARDEAYRRLLARGFRTDLLGVSMTRPNEAGYARPGIWVIDDWR